ncbi:hypothetical protein I5J18_17655 [Pseudomonas aeruginosa]|uniref:hypothetical protein n=2 Tax=Gammaproteobacteria TaxID=1236 RepID=UPI001A2CB9E8|nr:hypothetical protein [Pseudomonas aeruginosa]MBG7163066.1 hypothetical protein [Pseudomonas aeruginosa]MDY1507408.1 hypothetical protein [Pseudomonas aeruginosa]HCD9833450.1 hypothetical protein [Pseudomonas aeruginosa]HCE0988108.1 hypothetical protein [Pseudomonas aeruginosa]HCE3940889.1 hypothetical protein [Pseudomonas aeruginosa]
MRKRHPTDEIYQSIADRRSLKASRSTRRYNPNKATHAKRILDREVVPAPSSISFFGEENYKKFFEFLKKLYITSSRSKIIIDLQKTKEIKISAALILYATVEIIQKKQKKKDPIKTTVCRHSSVANGLQRIGFWKLTKESKHIRKNISMGLEVCSTSYKDQQSGDTSQLRRAITYVQEAIKTSGMNEEEGVKAFAAITESFSNVWQHAYDDDFYPKPLPDDEKNWWIAVEKIENQLFIAVYDSGVGIPATLSKKPWYSDIIDHLLSSLGFPNSNDSLAIRAAVEYGNSRFKTGGRGKGLAEAQDFVTANPEGQMLIYSGLGSYEFNAMRPNIKSIEPLPDRMPGTFIQWNIRLG